jgi:hypothetical protein
VGVLINLKRMMSVKNRHGSVNQGIVIDHHAQNGVPGTRPPIVNVPVSGISRSRSRRIVVFTPQPGPKPTAA